MDTEQLIRTLVSDNSHRARPVGYVLMLALLAAAPVSLIMFFGELGFRPDIMTAMRNPFFDLKFAVTLALAISAIAVALHLSRPEASLRGFGWYLLIPAGLASAATLMKEIAAEMWRQGGGDVSDPQHRILEFVSRDQAVRGLIASSDERFQQLSMRAERLESLPIALVVRARPGGRRAVFNRLSKPDGARGLKDTFAELSSFIRVHLVTALDEVPRPFTVAWQADEE